MSGPLFDSLHDGLGRVLDLRQQQHALTASNLANSDTPGYLAKYMPFDRVLESAVGAGDGLSMRRTDPRHQESLGADPMHPQVLEVEAPPWSLDGNSVSPELEMVRMTENSLMYNAITEGLGRRLAILKYAASNGKT